MDKLLTTLNLAIVLITSWINFKIAKTLLHKARLEVEKEKDSKRRQRLKSHR